MDAHLKVPAMADFAGVAMALDRLIADRSNGAAFSL
jgi:hypothetical protein